MERINPDPYSLSHSRHHAYVTTVFNPTGVPYATLADITDVFNPAAVTNVTRPTEIAKRTPNAHHPTYVTRATSLARYPPSLLMRPQLKKPPSETLRPSVLSKNRCSPPLT